MKGFKSKICIVTLFCKKVSKVGLQTNEKLNNQPTYGTLPTPKYNSQFPPSLISFKGFTENIPRYKELANIVPMKSKKKT